MKKITIIIPICNVAAYLEKCLDSVINQTLKEIDIICIDDNSTDGSSQILEAYAKNDDRIKVITYTENKSASQARKDGVNEATGKYIMFLDGDDTLELNSCEVLYQLMEREGVDMLHFGTKVIDLGATAGKVLRKQEFLKPYSGRLQGKAVFEGCFIEKKYEFNIWNKIYKTSLCKKAFAYVKDGKYPKAQDLYAFFILAYFAESYLGREDLECYRYNFGSGITGRTTLSDTQFERYCVQADIATEINAFLVGVNAEEEYKEVVEDIYTSLLQETFWYWREGLNEDSKDNGFSMLLDHFGKERVLAFLADKYNKNKSLLAEKLQGLSRLETTKRSVNKLAYLCDSDMETFRPTVVEKTIEAYQKQGCSVIAVLEQNLNKDILTANDIDIVQLPNSQKMKYKRYVKRLNVLKRLVEEEKIDAVVYADNVNKFLLFDLLYFKLSNVPVIIESRSPLEKEFVEAAGAMAELLPTYKLADHVVVTDKIEKDIFEQLGVTADLLIPNTDAKKQGLRAVNRDSILWTGTVSMEDKECQAVVKLFAEVSKLVPKMQFILCNTALTPMQDMTQALRELGVNEKTSVLESIHELDTVNSKLRMHISMTTLVRAKEYLEDSLVQAIPVLMYEAINAEEVRENQGCIVTSNRNDLITNILTLFQQDEQWEKVSKDAAVAAQTKEGMTWQTILSQEVGGTQANTTKPLSEHQEDLNTILKMHQLGLDRLRSERAQLIKEQNMLMKQAEAAKESYKESLETLKAEYESNIRKYQKLDVKYRRLRGRYNTLENSFGYKVARILTWIPRKIKKLCGK